MQSVNTFKDSLSSPSLAAAASASEISIIFSTNFNQNLKLQKLQVIIHFPTSTSASIPARYQSKCSWLFCLPVDFRSLRVAG
jgi:hypothetical protein